MQIGAVSPSSPELARAMIADVKPDAQNTILEIGTGTGAITRFIEAMIPDSKCYLGIEIEKSFVDKLTVEFPHLNLICGDACKAEKLYLDSGLGKVSYIISGLPFVSLPKEVSAGILGEVDKFMEKGAMFRTFQYVHGYRLPPAVKFRKRMEEKYGKVERSPLIMRNIPPAYTLTWKTL